MARLVSSHGAVTGVTGALGLTFDDGPEPSVTPQLLDALAASGMRATFFLLADRAERYPQLVRRIADEGHEIGLHGADHADLTGASVGGVVRSIVGGRRRLERVARRRVRSFRPPFGRQSPLSYLVARAAGLRVHAWSVAADDWIEQPIPAVVDRWMEATAGDVVLAHDGLVVPDGEPVPKFDRTAAFDLLLDRLRARGLRSVTVQELMSAGEPVRFPWFAKGTS